MILDSLDHAQLYEGLHPGFAEGFAFIREHAEDDLPLGEYQICEGVYAKVQRLPLYRQEERKWEAHRDYIDIQFVKKGTEGIGAALLEKMTEIIPYSQERDIAFYSGEGNICKVCQGEFIVLYPHDSHMPTLQVQEGLREVDKIVVKVRV